MVHHQQWIDIHIAGQKGRVALHRLPNSDVPLLLGLPQLRELGAVIDLTATPKPTIQFTTIGSEKVEMDYGTGGHLLLNIGQGGRNKKSTRNGGGISSAESQRLQRGSHPHHERKAYVGRKFRGWQRKQKSMAEPCGRSFEKGTDPMRER